MRVAVNTIRKYAVTAKRFTATGNHTDGAPLCGVDFMVGAAGAVLPYYLHLGMTYEELDRFIATLTELREDWR